MSCIDRIEETLLQGLCDLAAMTRPDRDLIDRADRRDLGRSARQKDLVGQIQGRPLHRHFDHFNAHIAGDLNYGIARDPWQYRRPKRRRVELPVIDQKDVLARALGNHSAVVQSDALAVAAEQRFHFYELRIHVIRTGLSHRRQLV